ncbi:Adenylosuccinate synthetase [Porphyridium purpureum]|uniref:Adenylosuccinate synthetase n=1 Tax=Porphyridium purpureum TaxID=35688 RepID=A0A5J4ZAY4_PORPP|nr:Adenylosuccinate synthetase [Porphyridium purpureum]|eukprot:POR8110..scf295_1
MKREPALVVVLGAQWGDEGKGKLIDALGDAFDVSARCNGGANAGHTVVVEGVKYKFHLLPSSLLHTHTIALIGNGVVVHLASMLEEAAALEKQGVYVMERVFLSDRAHLVFDYHQTVDGLRETERAGGKIGTTRKGIGPCYTSKASRDGLRVGDIRRFRNFPEKYRRNVTEQKMRFGNFEHDTRAEIAKYYKLAHALEPNITDSVSFVNSKLDAGIPTMVEGANAALLDIDFGTYPYVTSSNCTIGGIFTGLGIAPQKLKTVYGVVKAYTTRVGEGPFPTEQLNDVGKTLQDRGFEFGSTTGRPRRCGWLDLCLLKYTTTLNGYTAICLTKLDIMSHFETVKVGVKYKFCGAALSYYPSDLDKLWEVEVEYIELPGWKGVDISHARRFDELPLNAQLYVKYIEDFLEVPIQFIGVGAARDAIIDRR